MILIVIIETVIIVKTEIEIVIASSKKIVNAVIVSLIEIEIISVCLIGTNAINLVTDTISSVIEIEQNQDVIVTIVHVLLLPVVVDPRREQKIHHGKEITKNLNKRL